MQTAIVIAIIAVAALFLVRRFVKSSQGQGSCGCGCESCGQASSCSEVHGLADLRESAAERDRSGR